MKIRRCLACRSKRGERVPCSLRRCRRNRRSATSKTASHSRKPSSIPCAIHWSCSTTICASSPPAAPFTRPFGLCVKMSAGRLLYDLDDGQWNIPALRLLLGTIIPKDRHGRVRGRSRLPRVGRRTMLLNARKVIYETSTNSTILLAFTDVTARRTVERRCRSCCAKRTCCCRRCSTASPTACRSSPASCCIKARAVPRRRPACT